MVRVMVPDMGEGVEKATVSYWYFKEGDAVEKDADLVELATDKAAVNVSSPAQGVLKQVLMQEGTEVKPGDLLGIIE